MSRQNVQTIHQIYFANSTDLKNLENESVHLMVTSPPYPMIEMWDDIFSEQNSGIKQAFERKDGNRAFDLMHQELNKVWNEVYRVLVPGGFACINIGDATRKIDSEFKLYVNHTRILEHCLNLGFNALPEILWWKQTNTPNKFLGSGMLPAGAYVTLEHEHILIFRKGSKREFKTREEKLRRLHSAFFWEERNNWFTDIWEDLKGTKQSDIDKRIRERSGAYPFELPYRIANMFSLRGDTILDPFLGTGTTTAVAMATGRNSVGYEIDPNFKDLLHERFRDIISYSNKLIRNRITNHLRFVKNRMQSNEPLGYINRNYKFPVMTGQETEMVFDELESVEIREENLFVVKYKEKTNFTPEEFPV